MLRKRRENANLTLTINYDNNTTNETITRMYLLGLKTFEYDL